MSNFKQLMELLQANSTVQTAEFTQLREEWELINVKKDDGGRANARLGNQCLCGKDIVENIRLKLKNYLLL